MCTRRGLASSLPAAPSHAPRLWLSRRRGSVGDGGGKPTAGQALHRKQEKSTPHLSSRVISADEGLWDVFAKDIPRGATSYTVSLDKLRQGVTYEFRVVAVNQAGYGEPSSPSTAVSGREPCPSRGRSRCSFLPSEREGMAGSHGAKKEDSAQRHAGTSRHRPSLENTVVGERVPPGP